MNAQTPPVVTAELLARIAPSEVLLRAIQAGGWASLAELAEKSGRPAGNMKRDLSRLSDAGLVRLTGGIDKPALTVEAGAGLAAIDNLANPVRGPELAQIWTHADLIPNPDQPRKDFKPERLAELAASIKSGGQLQNILARPNPYQPGPALQIVGGERRWRAIGLLIERGDWAADAQVRVEVRDLTDQQVDTLAIVENMQRENLTLLEEARAFQRLAKVHGWTIAEIADAVDKEARVVQLRINLLELNGGLTQEEQRQLEDNEITYTKALDMLRNRPKPIELSAAEALTLAEVAAAAAGERPAAYHHKAECVAHAAQIPLVASLIERGLLTIEGPDHFTGGFVARFTDFLAFDKFKDQYPGVVPADRASALLAMRAAVLGADEAERLDSESEFAAPWLNGPFELTDEGKAILEQRRQEQATNAVRAAESDAQRALRMKRLSEADARSADLLKGLAKPRVGAEIAGFAEVLAAAEAPLPWSVGRHEGWPKILDANGKPVDFPAYASDAAPIRLRMIMAAVNAAAGLAPMEATPAAGDAAGGDQDDAEEDEDQLEERLCVGCSQVFDTATEEHLCAACASEQQAGEEEEEDTMLGEDAPPTDDLETRIAAAVATSGLPEHVVRKSFEEI